MAHITIQVVEPLFYEDYVDDENFSQLSYFMGPDLEATLVGPWNCIVLWLLEHYSFGSDLDDANLVADIQLEDESLPAWILEIMDKAA